MGSKSAIGIGNGICFKQIRNKGGGSYIDPLVRDSIVGLWKFDQNTNESPTRNIIKNTIKGKGGDLELLNFAYKANSGYNGYPEDFTSWGPFNAEVSKGGNKAKNTKVDFNLLYTYSDIKRDVGPFKVKISNFTKGIIRYWYRQEDGIETTLLLEPITVNNSNGLIELPKSYNTVENGTGFRGGFTGNDTNIGVTIEQLPLYEGALVTDGKDDMIVSQKTVQEMLGGSKEITVVSMIHQIGRLATNTNLFTNCIQANTGSKGYNIVNYQTSLGKTGIYGYSRANVSVANKEVVINNILGDKADYLTNVSIGALTSNEKFSVVGYLDVSPQQVTSVAVYWTFIANKVLTTDEINQIIAYFKLDKYVTPQVIYDVKRQGLTNDTPAADWYLKDFSGNGYDMQLYNYAKSKDSGIGKYAEDFTNTDWIAYSNVIVSKDKITVNSLYDEAWFIYKSKNNRISPMKIKIVGIPANAVFMYRYCKNSSDIDATYINISEDGIYDLPESVDGNTFTVGFMVQRQFDWTHIEITQIPDYEGALVSDGKSDYGKAEGLPILKDYTVAADRAIVDGFASKADGGVFTKGVNQNGGAFAFDYRDEVYSFGAYIRKIVDTKRFISYQSKYINNGKSINVGTIVDANPLVLAKLGSENNRYSALALYSMLLFPYSLSEFLLERQLKKYKLGTLYPDMVEVRPIVKSNTDNYMRIEYRNGQDGLIQPGSYLPVGSILRISVILNNTLDEVSSLKVNGVDIPKSNYSGDKFWIYDATVTKSPQKIDITIDEYIRFEDIVQPYPAMPNILVNGKYVTWGDKLKVGDEFRYMGNTNLLSDIYTFAGAIRFNGNQMNYGSYGIISKNMVFTANKTWLLDTTEPHAIYSPQKLNIPNSSLKILGYVPDLTGKGNHGKLNNFAYTEDSGVAADGSIKFDGTDDHITIPTLAHGGKCVMMKVNWSNVGILYDQRPSDGHNTFDIYTGENHPAYSARNNGSTYIDGILNTNIIPSDLAGITHNITAVNDTATDNSTTSPRLGTSFTNATFSNMSLYEFMLFPEIPSEDEIKKLNDVMGIEGGYVESPNYYWDAYGKKNTDTDRNLIADQVSKDVANALEVKNVGYNSESGYSQIVDTVLFKNWIPLGGATYMEYTLVNDTTINITKSNRVNIDAFYCRANVKKKSYYKITGLQEGQGIQFGFTNNIIYTAESDGVHEVDWSLVSKNYQELSATFVGECNITIEQVAQYPNGLLLDGVEDHAVNTVIPAMTDFTIIAKREFLESALVNNQTFLVKGDAINGNNNINSLLMECYYNAQNYIISFSHQQIVPLEESKISWITPTSYNGNALIKGSGVDSVGLTIGRYKHLYRKAVFYKAMFYTKTIDRLSINMLKNLFERDELIDVTNPIFKKEEL